MSVIGGHGFRLRSKRLLFSISGFRDGLLYSSSAAEATQSSDKTPKNFTVEYLVSSLGFSREEAISISTSTRFTHLKSTEKADSVINFFKQNGFDDAQIRRIVSSNRNPLSANVQKTLEPKFKFLQGLGLSRSDLTKFVTGNSLLFERGLDTRIIPTVNYLKQLLGSEENVVKAISKSNWLLSSGFALKRARRNVLFLKEHGFSNEMIRKLFQQQPRIFVQNIEWFEEAMRRAEEELGIPRDSAMFIGGIVLVGFSSKSTLEIKYGVFRSFGWTDSDINTMARKYPYSLLVSEANIKIRLKFFMQEIGLSPDYLVHHPAFFTYSFEKRVLPRYEVLKTLKERELLKSDVSLYFVVRQTEAKFVEYFLQPYKDELPDLYQAYIKRMKQ